MRSKKWFALLIVVILLWGMLPAALAAANQHKWGEWYVSKEAAPLAAGIEERKCSHCGLTGQRPVYAEGTVLNGDRGAYVKELQKALNDAGYSCGKADGIFGNKTRDALQAFQRDHGMKPDGVGHPGLADYISNPVPLNELPPEPAAASIYAEWAPPAEGDQTKAAALHVAIVESSAPANGKYYKENESIGYTIQISNTGDQVQTVVAVADSLFMSSDDMSENEDEDADGEPLRPGETRAYSGFYTVDAADCARGYAANAALVTYFGEAGIRIAVSEPVMSKAGEAGDIVYFPAGFIAPITLDGEADDDDRCICALTAAGDGAQVYILHRCALHQPIAEQIDSALALLEPGDDPIYEIEYGTLLWQISMDDMYATCYEYANPGEAQRIVIANQALFTSQAQAHKADLDLRYPNDPGLAMEKYAQYLMYACADMCYLLHDAPAQRRDSLMACENRADAQSAQCAAFADAQTDGSDVRFTDTFCEKHAQCCAAAQALLSGVQTTEEITAAWEQIGAMWLAELDAEANARYLDAETSEARTTIAADRLTFGSYLTQRSAFLTLFYPDHPEIVAEMMAQTIRQRVLSLCEGGK